MTREKTGSRSRGIHFRTRHSTWCCSSAFVWRKLIVCSNKNEVRNSRITIVKLLKLFCVFLRFYYFLFENVFTVKAHLINPRIIFYILCIEIYFQQIYGLLVVTTCNKYNTVQFVVLKKNEVIKTSYIFAV